MAGTITKNLKLKAVLDDQAFRKQIQDLKKELGSVEMGGGAAGNVGGLDKSAKMLADAALALRQVAESFKRGTTGIGGGGISKSTDTTFSKAVKQDLDREKAKAIFSERQLAKEQSLALKGAEKVAKQEAKAKEDERKKDINSAKDAVAAVLSKSGMGLPMARQAAQAMGSSSPGMMESAGGLLRGGGGSLLKGAAGLAGGAVAAINFGSDMYFQHNRIATMQANREQTTGRSLLQGKGLEGSLQEAALNDRTARAAGGAQGGLSGALMGGLKGALAGGSVGSIIPGLGTLVGAIGGGIGGAAYGGYQGYKEGAEKGGQSEAEKVNAQIALAADAKAQAKALREQRVDAMRGGAANSDQLTYLQGEGVKQGFSMENTLSQFSGSKQFLGKDTGQILPELQKMMNQTGVSVEDQASAIDTFKGAKKGTDSVEGYAQSVDILKKAVAGGMDISKTGQAQRAVQDYIKSNLGTGQMDTDALSTKMINAASGFGGGEITSTSLSQASQLLNQQNKESTSMEGLSGLGNINAITKNFGNLDVGTMMSLSNLDADSTAEDYQNILNKSPNTKGKDYSKQIEKTMTARQNNLYGGMDLLQGADENTVNYIGAMERGQSSNKFNNAKAIRGFTANTPDSGTDQQFADANQSSKEKSSLVLDFSASQEAFKSGVALMGKEAESAGKLLSTLVLQLQRSVEATNTLVRNKNGN